MKDGDDTARYEYWKLTAAIDDKQSPLRRYLDSTYPHRRAVTTPHSGAGPAMVVPGTPGVNPGTIGTAFDVLVGLRYQPDTVPALARPFAGRKKRDAPGWAELLNLVVEDDGLIEAAAWAYALAVEDFRSLVMPYDLADLLDRKDGYNEFDLLGIASAEAVKELARLDELAAENLYPHLGSIPASGLSPDERRTAAWTTPDTDGAGLTFGPVFTGSELCAADADLIHDGTLYEFKTRLGAKNRRGLRVDRLPLIDLYQLLGYVLFDTHDEYGIHHVAVYSARYARHTTWPLVDLLDTMAGRPVDLAEERAIVWALLDSGVWSPQQ